MTDKWRPAQYEKFREERAQPFFDLLSLVEARPGMRAVDLGCGTGELTSELHRRLACESTLGVDTSPAMLEKAAGHAGGGLRFEVADLGSFETKEPFDLVFSNAAVQWVPEHERLFARLRPLVAVGGQLAVQMPANHDHAAHLAAQAVAEREPFSGALGGYVRESPVLTVERYAMLLHELGFERQHVRLQVYPHLLPSREGVVEWVKGTLLTDYEKRLSAEQFAAFLEAYRLELATRLPAASPFFYPFKRVLLWASG
ncbi:MAG: methyltransferase domain-containing protein [Myxococcales bacterium]|nr:MAG: methyltransferase domain-containing protein [Myxococcales bacterium]